MKFAPAIPVFQKRNALCLRNEDMMFNFQDFFPRITRQGIMRTESETLSKAVQSANEWVNANRIEVINIETILLPNMTNGNTKKRAYHIAGHDFASANWIQVVRVWYRE